MRSECVGRQSFVTFAKPLQTPGQRYSIRATGTRIAATNCDRIATPTYRLATASYNRAIGTYIRETASYTVAIDPYSPATTSYVAAIDQRSPATTSYVATIDQRSPATTSYVAAIDQRRSATTSYMAAIDQRSFATTSNAAAMDRPTEKTPIFPEKHDHRRRDLQSRSKDVPLTKSVPLSESSLPTSEITNLAYGARPSREGDQALLRDSAFLRTSTNQTTVPRSLNTQHSTLN